MTKPPELEEAELIDALCRRWSCPPSVVLQQDVSALRDLVLLAMAQGDGQPGSGPVADSGLGSLMVSI